MDSTESDRQGRTLSRRAMFSLIALLVIAALSYATWKALDIPRGEGFLTMMREILKGLRPEEKLIANAILQNYSEYRENAVRWSGTFHSCLFVSAALGAFSALVLKLEFFIKNVELKKDLAALSAMSSALLITFFTVGDFQGRWQANRLAAGQMESLGYEFATADRRDLVYFSSRLRDISMSRNQEIAGGQVHSGQTRDSKQ